MRKKEFLKFLLFIIITIFIPLKTFASNKLLNEKNIHTVMENLLRYHVEHDKMNPAILGRSFKLFISQFDSAKTYFLKKEVTPYMHPSNEELELFLKQYNNHQLLKSYEKLNQLICQSIERARKWRESLWEREKELFTKAEISVEENYEDVWPKTEEELKEKMFKQVVGFIRSQKKSLGSKDISQVKKDILKLYEKRISSIENEYLYQNTSKKSLPLEEKNHLLAVKALKSLAKSLDSHTSFFSSQEAYDMRVQLEKGFHGIGVVLEESIEGIAIKRLIKGGPAEESGSIQIDDTIVEVNGQKVSDYSFKEVLEMIRGEKGSTISLELKRIKKESDQEIAQLVKVELTRGKVVLDEKRVDIDYESFADGIIGKITLYSFYDGEDEISSEKDIRKALEELRQKGEIKGLVLDLRDNLGGFLMQAVKVAGLFISNGVVVVAKYSDGESKYFRDVDGHTYFDGPLIVLTSKASASAAEIVAQTLQDYGTAIIVGDEQTYGKGSIQHQTVTNEHAETFFKVTVGRYYTVSGKSTQIDGVSADIVVPTKYYNKEIGEQYLEFPLPNNTISPTYNDSLDDMIWDSKKWYVKYYLPSLQKQVGTWKNMLSILRKNSQKRIEDNKNYISFLEEDHDDSNEEHKFGQEDLQMTEAVNIIKDMVLLKPKYQEKEQQYALEIKKNPPKKE